MVRGYLVLSVAACLVAVISAQKSSLDAVDIDAVFKNERLLKNYVDCLLDKKPCSKEGTELKNRIPRVLENSCDDCSETEKERALKAIKTMAKQKPEMWAEVKAKFDPTGEKSKDFAKRYKLESELL